MEPEPKTESRPKGTIWILALVAFAVLAAVAAVFVFRHSGGEPSIRGRGLTEWGMLSLCTSNGSPESLEATRAIRDIGTNAIPFLLRFIEGKPTAKDKVADFLRTKGLPKLADWLGGGAQGRSVWMSAPIGIFGILGTNAQSAAPKLAELIDRFSPENASIAAAVLAHLGRDGQLQLLSKFPDPKKGYPPASAQGAKEINSVLALSQQQRFEPEVLIAIRGYAGKADHRFPRVALTAIRSLEGNLDLKRSLLDWAFKVGWEHRNALAMLESNPELIAEYRGRIAGLNNLTDPDAIAVRNRLLSPTNSVGR